MPGQWDRNGLQWAFSTGNLQAKSTVSLIPGLGFGSIGIGYFVFGRRQSNTATRWCGLALMLYPLLVTNAVAMVCAGIALMLTPRFIDL